MDSNWNVGLDIPARAPAYRLGARHRMQAIRFVFKADRQRWRSPQDSPLTQSGHSIRQALTAYIGAPWVRSASLQPCAVGYSIINPASSFSASKTSFGKEILITKLQLIELTAGHPTDELANIASTTMAKIAKK
jgi:hypothetical protein